MFRRKTWDALRKFGKRMREKARFFPGSESHNAFWMFCGILIAIVALQIVLFKRLKWF